MARRRSRAEQIPRAQAEIVGSNIQALRRRNGWSQAHLGRLMGWPTPFTVCAAEGHRDGRQRGFTLDEVQRLASIFSLMPRQLITRCANCDGHPPPGFTCQSCGSAGQASRLEVAATIGHIQAQPGL